MKKPILVIMAAGMGSRFGGLKQAAKLDEFGHTLLDFSIYDALRAGFGRVICIIKPEMRKDFAEVILSRMNGKADVQFAYQTMDKLPQGFSVPEGRVKPWGTAHAVLCAKEMIDAPFAVINADDFYGRTAFETIAGFLMQDETPNRHAMVGYRIENTLTENGTVSRGVCEVDQNSWLKTITERTSIEPTQNGAVYTENGQKTFVPAGTFVSMNLWGFKTNILEEIEERFAPWLEENLQVNPGKCEYYLPMIPDLLIREGKARVCVLPTSERWYGMTYAADLNQVREALNGMKDKGVYPQQLWN